MNNQIRIAVKGQERRDFLYPLVNVAVQQNFAVAGNQIGKQNFVVGSV